MKYHIVVAIPCQKHHIEYLEQTGKEKCRFVFYTELSDNWPDIEAVEKKKEQIYEDIAKADIIIGEPPLALVRKMAWSGENNMVPGEIPPAGPDKEGKYLKWVQMTWAGTDIYTAPENKSEGEFPASVRLTNMSGAFGTIISEYVMGAVLYFYRNFGAYLRHQERRLWHTAGAEETLEGKEVLILGTGDIGSQVARRMKCFDAHVVGYRRNVVDKPPYFDEICGQEDWISYLKRADVIVACLPHSAATAGLIGRNELESMKKDAVFINVGRGKLVKTEELVEVLRTGHLRGVALDVTNPEPLPADHPLWEMERVLLTPHIAGVSFGHCAKTEDKIIEICAENLKHFLNKEALRNEIR